MEPLSKASQSQTAPDSPTRESSRELVFKVGETTLRSSFTTRFNRAQITSFTTCFTIKSLGGMKQSNVVLIGIESLKVPLVVWLKLCDFLRQGLSQDGERQVEQCCVMVRFINMMLMSLCPKEIMFFEFEKSFNRVELIHFREVFQFTVVNLYGDVRPKGNLVYISPFDGMGTG